MSCCCGDNLGAGITSSRVSTWNPIPAVTTAPLADGINAPAVTGAAAARTVTSAAPLLRQARRIGYDSAAAINSVAGARAGQAIQTNGITVAPTNPRLRGGEWKASWTFGISDAALNPEARMFVGMRNDLTGPTAVDPTTQLNMIGVGCDAGETTLRFMARDGGANLTEIDLGAQFPVNTAAPPNHQLFRLIVQCMGGTAVPITYQWSVYNIDNGAVVSGQITGLAGPAIVNMGPIFWRATGPANAAVVSIDLVHLKIVTPF